MSNKTTAVIILAAGSSSRLGKPKQLLPYKRKNLLQHAIVGAEQSDTKYQILVLGANEMLIRDNINPNSTVIVSNPAWEEGMAGSLQVAVKHLLGLDPDLDQILVMLCDQPFVDSILLNTMIQKQSASDKGIVACQYKGTLGVPVLFTKTYFAEILDLSGNGGAKNLIQENLQDVIALDFPEGGIDIDTMEDYRRLKE
jgi:molybdenum cofactor cytidylyltransferase